MKTTAVVAAVVVGVHTKIGVNPFLQAQIILPIFWTNTITKLSGRCCLHFDGKIIRGRMTKYKIVF